MGAHWKRLGETLPMRDHNSCFRREIKKILPFLDEKKCLFLFLVSLLSLSNLLFAFFNNDKCESKMINKSLITANARKKL